MKAVLVFHDGRTEVRDDCQGQGWWEIRDVEQSTHRTRYFKACEVAHFMTDHDGEAIGGHVLVYAEQPRREYINRPKEERCAG